ncbi:MULTISPECIES: tetratricopeptide repeat protein [unclassified Saccharothrix]|uniref:tetratricopeptide repeat protein n=1 Tax=unclassified Saccharothrix TaxID=2593673 RepID=UPI00307CE465
MDHGAENVISGTTHGPVVQAGQVNDIHFHHHEPAAPVIPRQLPPAPRLFAGRRRELDDLDRWFAAEEALVAVVSGPGGVGKTSLALRWLHDARTRFPDGQLYVELGAHAPGGPATPSEVLEWFLLALGTPAAEIPVELPRRQAAFRTLTAERRVAFLLDDAVSAAQIRPLLPTSPHSAVLVTSRWRLSGLAVDGARFVEVESFDEDASLELLERALGPRVASEPDAARELAHLCGGLPIALSVVGARLSTHPRRTLSGEVGSLRTERLRSLNIDGGVSVEAVFDLSYVELPARHARVYRLCSVNPGTSFGVGAAAAAAGEPSPDIAPVLADLVDKNLLNEVGDERYGFHDLLRAHARQHAEWHSAAEREAALWRVVEWYLDGAVAADRVIVPDRPRVGPRYDAVPPGFGDVGEALDWLEAERDNLVAATREAADQGRPDLAWQLAEAQWGLYLHRRHLADWVATHELGAEAARLAGNTVAQSRLRLQLAIGYVNQGRGDDASREVALALDLATTAGDLGSVATALRQLGRIARTGGDSEAALAYFRQSLDVETTLGRARGVAFAHRRIAEALTDLGRHGEAITEFTTAETILADLAQTVELARLRSVMAHPLLALNRVDEAAQLLEAAHPVLARTGSPSYLAAVLLPLAEVARRRDDPTKARDHLRAAADAYTAAGEQVPDEIRSLLAD